MAIDSINGAASPIAGAIKEAARTTGASFEYLLTTAQIESNLNPAAQAATSSAGGLYQFIDQTWLATMKQAGPALGLGNFAAAIAQTPDGQYVVPDPAARATIMRLRSDPTVSAAMAGVYTRSNQAKLTAAIGRAPSEGELYIAHFLGPDGAAKLISTAASQPQASAAAIFPAAAAANRPIFYDRFGHALGTGAVYRKLTGRYEVARALAFAPRPPATVPDAPDTAGVTQAYAEVRMSAPPPAQVDQPAPAGKPFFQTMFTDVPRHGVSQAVNSLWAPARAEPQPVNQPSGLYDLFKDVPPPLRRSQGGKV
jgi:hypothetical protein